MTYRARTLLKSMEKLKPSPISDDTVKSLQESASSVVEGNFASSKLFNESQGQIPRFDSKELDIGRILGHGTFSLVSEIKGFIIKTNDKQKPTQRDSSIFEGKNHFTREEMAQHCHDNTDYRYVVKKLDENCRLNSESFLLGTIELATETRFLEVLEHPNLIKMKAVANVSPYANDFFLILERIDENLETRITNWKETCYGYTFLISEKRKQAIVSEKLSALRDISSVMLYMHSRNIIYRDLKPRNVGFDVHNNVKIFDLGSAKDLEGSDCKSADGMYKLTGLTGSIPYIAPEVAKSLPYNLSADVYSFGMLFWQMIEMELPFKFYTAKHYYEHVVVHGHRPVCNALWPEKWTTLMKKSWSHDPSDRPTFAKIYKILLAEVEDLAEEVVAVNSCGFLCKNFNLGTVNGIRNE